MRPLLLALLLIAAPLPASAENWSTSAIDPQTGWTVSMLVDGAFHAHAAYWTPGAFKYSFFDGTAWEVDTIPTTPVLEGSESATPRAATPASAQLIFVGRTSLALTPETPWVAHMKVVTSHYEDGPLRVSHKAGGAWVTEDIDAQSASSIHIAANDEGTIYLAYRSTTLGPRLAVRNGTWTNEPIDIPNGPVDLEVDRNGTPWVLYWDGAVLGIARRESPGVWTRIPVDDAAGGQGDDLAFDSQNRPCVAYAVQTPGTAVYRLTYARWTGTAWVHAWVAPAGDQVACESLVLDASDEPWIAYRDFSSLEVNVAHRTSGSWIIDFVDAPTSSYASMTLDALGHHWMAYNATSGGGLRMARTQEPTGVGDRPTNVSALRLAIAGANPMLAGAETRLRIETPEAGAVRLETFDLSGRRVAPSRSWSVPAGVTMLPWTAPAADGLCFVRATLGGRSTVARVMVVR